MVGFRNARKNAGYTLERASEKLGVSPAAISFWENGVKMPEAGRLVAIADLYGVTVDEATSATPLNAESGLTVAQKFEAGLDPKSATKFELQTMTTTKSSATVTFPGTKGTGNYTVKAGTTKGGSDIGTQTSTQTDASGEGVNSATINLSGHENELIYFTVETN